MFDPREPQPDRLPKIEIPLKKRDSEYKGTAKPRYPVAEWRIAEALAASPAAGEKRKADEEGDNESKKPRLEAPAEGGVKRKAEDKGDGPLKKAKPNIMSRDRTNTGSEIDTSKIEYHADSCPGVCETQPSTEVSEQCSEATKTQSPVEPTQKSDSTAKNQDTCTMAETGLSSDESIEPKYPVVAGTGAVGTAGETAPIEASDKGKSPYNATPAQSPTTGGTNKRKADEEVESPSKKPKIQSSVPVNALCNYRQACFINGSLQLLHSIPTLAAVKNEDSDVVKADEILSKTEMQSAVSGGRSRQKEGVRAKLRDHLKSKADRNEL
jgi:hypothetical protein